MYQKMPQRWLTKYTRPFYLQKKGLLMWFMAVRVGWGEGKLKRTLDDIDELCKKYPWLREVEGI